MSPHSQNGKIYNIWDTNNDAIYIGSTTRLLCEMMSGHRRDRNIRPNCLIYETMNDVGVEHFFF